MIYVMMISMMIMLEVNHFFFKYIFLSIPSFSADLISLLDVNPHNDHPGLVLESEFFDETDFAVRYSSIQRRVISARMGMY
jgi:hypothetical protein